MRFTCCVPDFLTQAVSDVFLAFACCLYFDFSAATEKDPYRSWIEVRQRRRDLSHAMRDFDDKGIPSWAEPQMHHTSIRALSAA
jgi:hypothetical protein